MMLQLYVSNLLSGMLSMQRQLNSKRAIVYTNLLSTISLQLLMLRSFSLHYEMEEPPTKLKRNKEAHAANNCSRLKQITDNF